MKKCGQCQLYHNGCDFSDVEVEGFDKENYVACGQFVKPTNNQAVKKILQCYMKHGFRWIYKYPLDKLLNKERPTRVFYSEPWFSLEGGMTWVDLNSCYDFANRDDSKHAEFIDIEIVDLDKPIKIEDYIKQYC